jgi:drug/metabolite transporter (DMT)-like permease
MSRIIKAFVVVSTLSRSNNNNGIHGFETAWMQHRSCCSFSQSTTRGASLDHFYLSIRPSQLGLLPLNKNENNRNRHLCAVQNTDNEIDNSDSEYDRSLLVLATVPIAWGTFEPAVRLVYKYEPLMPPLVFSFAYYMVATSVLTIGTLYSSAAAVSVSRSASSPSAQNRPMASAAVATTTSNEDETGDTKTIDETTHDAATNKDFGSFFSGLPLSTRGGIELGTYLFIGNAFQVIGLKTVPSDRAAFLLQLTTIFVPLLKSLTASTVIPLQTWIACLVALLGVALIGIDDGTAGAVSYNSNGLNDNDISSYSDILHMSSSLFDRLPAFSVEDGYIVLASVFYTFHCVRLETYARSTALAIGLATAKATTEMLWSGFVIFGCILAAVALGVENNNVDGAGVSTDIISGIVDTARISGERILSYGEGIQEQMMISSSTSTLLFTSGGWPRVGLATFWIGAVTVAYTIYAQSYGQSRVTAVTANLIYSSQPIFTAMVAYFLLGESLGANGYIGGMLIGAAVLLVIAAEAETDQPPETMTNAED